MRNPFDTFCERDVLVTPTFTDRFELLTRKGVFPYEFMDSMEMFEET